MITCRRTQYEIGTESDSNSVRSGQNFATELSVFLRQLPPSRLPRRKNVTSFSSFDTRPTAFRAAIPRCAPPSPPPPPRETACRATVHGYSLLGPSSLGRSLLPAIEVVALHFSFLPLHTPDRSEEEGYILRERRDIRVHGCSYVTVLALGTYAAQ